MQTGLNGLGDMLNSAVQKNTSGLQHLSSQNITEREQSQNRTDAIAAAINEFEHLCGMEQPADQIHAIMRRLEESKYSETQLRIALPWIFRGDPMKYGRIRYSDFFPTQEQLQGVGTTVTQDLDRAYRRGYREGYEAGQRDGYDELARREEHLRLLESTKDLRKLETNRQYLQAQAAELAALDERLREREQSIMDRERKLRIVNRFIKETDDE